MRAVFDECNKECGSLLSSALCDGAEAPVGAWSTMVKPMQTLAKKVTSQTSIGHRLLEGASAGLKERLSPDMQTIILAG